MFETEDQRKIPHVVGAIDGTHNFINKTPISESWHDYCRRKQRYSISTQAVV